MSKASDAADAKAEAKAEAKADAAEAKRDAKSAADLKASLPLLTARMVDVLASHGVDKDLHAELRAAIAASEPKADDA